MENIKEYQDFVNESLNQPILESVEWKGVEIVPARVHGGKDPKTGKPKDLTGRIVFIYNNTELYYKVKAKVKKLLVTWYDGPIAVESVWKSKETGDIYVKDNTDKVFKLDTNILNTLASKVKAKASSIAFSGTGEIKGVEGDYDATLTKVA